MSTGGTGDFLIKPWEVRGEGREFGKISQDFEGAAKTLEQGMAGLGTPWGGDAPGSGFGTLYTEAQGMLLAGLNGLAGRLGQIGSNLGTMADSVERTDGDVGADLGRVHPDVAPVAPPKL
ncbi:hypothetical protein ACIA8O_34855 [Kitasatospora sp. NPDC051853]|uniref:hypothetical protein n=1 Tax=Kitasatospora sp. NPDC051853 TaxID=3364058 RepID=UPI0037968039